MLIIDEINEVSKTKSYTDNHQIFVEECKKSYLKAKKLPNNNIF